jgi:hypothetical protein
MDSKPIRDSREAGVRPFVIFCAAVAALGTFNSGINTVSFFTSSIHGSGTQFQNSEFFLFVLLQSALNIPGDYVRNCPEPGIQNYPGSTLPMCIPMSDWVW